MPILASSIRQRLIKLFSVVLIVESVLLAVSSYQFSYSLLAISWATTAALVACLSSALGCWIYSERQDIAAQAIRADQHGALWWQKSCKRKPSYNAPLQVTPYLITRWLLVLRADKDNVVVWRDSMSFTEFRQLTVLMRWHVQRSVKPLIASA